MVQASRVTGNIQIWKYLFTSLEMLKTELNTTLSIQMELVLLWEERWSRWPPEVFDFMMRAQVVNHSMEFLRTAPKATKFSIVLHNFDYVFFSKLFFFFPFSCWLQLHYKYNYKNCQLSKFQKILFKILKKGVISYFYLLQCVYLQKKQYRNLVWESFTYLYTWFPK